MKQSIRILMLVTAMTASFFTLGAEDQQNLEPKHRHKTYASFFLTIGSAGVDVGDNVIFNDQVTLSGIEYDDTTGVFTLKPGTYAVTYFFAPFTIPAVNLYVNDKLIFNSPLGGASSVFTVKNSINTLTLKYIKSGSFDPPGVNESWASIAISKID